MMNVQEIILLSQRCRRELDSSTTATMLAVAFRYFNLALDRMRRDKVPSKFITMIEEKLTRVYKKRKIQLL